MAKRKGKQPPKKVETPDSLPVVNPAKLPHKSETSRHRNVHQPVGSREIFVDHVTTRATQYEFYFPIAVWHLQATRDFINGLRLYAGGATVFKGATGVWREEKKKDEGSDQQPDEVEEDVYIYRMVVDAERFSPDAHRPGLLGLVADYVADLSVCHFIQQREVLFTETQIIMDRSFLRLAGELKNPAVL